MKGFPLDVSSSQIRARVKAGLPMELLVPAAVGFAESLLFGIYVLAELFALSLEFFGLQPEFLEGGFVGELSFVIACSEAGDFIGECLAENFGEALFFVSEFCLGFCDAVGGFVSVAFVLEPESFAFGIEE